MIERTHCNSASNVSCLIEKYMKNQNVSENEIKNCSSNYSHSNLKRNIYILINKKKKIMSELMPCPHQGCKSGKVHCLVGFDIFWNDCPMCKGSGYVKRPGSDINIETRPGSEK